AWPDASGRTAPLSRLTARGMHPSGVPEARWWLVVEDDGSRGHTIEILINGELVETVRSGEIPRILDVGAHLVPGENRILLRSTSTQASGGPLYVYLGSGNDRDGTVMIDQPEVQFALRAAGAGTYQRECTARGDRTPNPERACPSCARPARPRRSSPAPSSATRPCSATTPPPSSASRTTTSSSR